MKPDRRQFIAASMLTAAALPRTIRGQESPAASIVALRGRITCLTETLAQTHKLTPECDTRGHVYALKTDEGTFHPLLPTNSSAAVWMDWRFRTRELQLTVRRFPATDFVEVVKFQSWVGNKLHDLYYYCDTCAITANKPGPCDCCQAPVEFRETPAA